MKYWLDSSGVAEATTDHFATAERILKARGLMSAAMKLCPELYDWVYNRMFELGYMRVQTEGFKLYADNGKSRSPSRSQRIWLEDQMFNEHYVVYVNDNIFESTRKGRPNAAEAVAKALLA